MRKSAARGASARQSGFSIHAEMKRSAADAAAAAPTSSGERSPAGQVPPRRARVGGVEEAVGEAVDAHGEGPRAGHGQRHPHEHVPARPAVGRQHHRDVGERQGEDGVLELDRVEEVAETSRH